MKFEKNNFDLLRLLFASVVCMVHAYELSGELKLQWISDVLSSSVAVKSFFVVSGFLIFMSYERASSVGSYFNKRVRRIYPGYLFTIFFLAFSLSLISTKSISQYFTVEWIKYVLANLVFLNFIHPVLPGVFEGNRISAINGALWTLKIEVMFYFTVPIFVTLFNRFGRLRVISLVYLLSILYSSVLDSIAVRTGSGMYEELSRQLPGQLSYFMAGAFFYYFFPIFKQYANYFMLAGAFSIFINFYVSLSIVVPIALASIVIYLAYFRVLGNFGKYGDFSYGVYILHFPVIQSILWWGGLKNSPALYLTAIFSITLILAMALWHMVEKRFLSRWSHYGALDSHGD